MPWHQSVVDEYAQLMQAETLPHALIFYGNAGIGKRAFVNSLAALLLCQQPQNNRACEQCKTCLLRIAGNHPDYKVVEPEDKGKQIGVDQIRKLQESVYSMASQTSWLGAWKVVLIDPAQMMNINAANSLLKILEEPASNTTFLLLTDYLQWLLPTVRSRCQQRLLASPDEQSALTWLQSQTVNGKSLDEKILQALLPFYSQQPGLILELIADGNYEQRLQMIEHARLVLGGQLPNHQLMDIAEQLGSQRELLENNLAWFYEEVHQHCRINIDSKPSAVAVNSDFNAALHQALREGRSNVNPKLLWQNLLIQWQKASTN